MGGGLSYPGRVLTTLHRLALRIYRKLPPRGRRLVVRGISPKYTVGAICVIERTDGAILLVRTAYRSRWGIPGGLVKRGELPADAARREVFEEVGLRVDLIGEPAVVVEPEPQSVDIIFRARPRVAGDTDVQIGSPEITEVRWFAADALPELQIETTTALMALARRTAVPDVRGQSSRGGLSSVPRPDATARD